MSCKTAIKVHVTGSSPNPVGFTDAQRLVQLEDRVTFLENRARAETHQKQLESEQKK